MESSPGSSSNGSAGQHPPAFLRLSSEVVEKPASYGSIGDEHDMVIESLDSSSPVIFPNSPASSGSKPDNEGKLAPWWLRTSPCFSVPSVPPAQLSDVEVEAQGDVDEGFDEEFEERDLNESEPKYFELGDLDPKELQQLLQDPHLPNLEDYDLGVDVLDSESQLHLSTAVSPYGLSHPPNSPYQAMVTTSPAPAMDHQLYNDYNLTESFFNEDPPSVQSNISALTATSYGDELPITMLRSECNTAALPDSTSPPSLSESEPRLDHSPSPCPQPYQHHHNQSSPVLTTAAAGLDLAETSNLLSTDTLIELSAALSTEDAIVDTQSMYMFGNGMGHLSLLPHGSVPPQQSTASSAQVVTTLLDSAMLPVCSQASQTHSGMSRGAVTPPPQPSSRTFDSVYHSNRHPPSSSPTPSPKPAGVELSDEDKKLVEMPYYQFRKLLDDPSIPERKKEEIKNIRRRGRNKTAAKLCRNKKLQMIMGLEQEVEQLRKTKSLISVRTQSLEREIAELKKKCHTRIGTNNSR